MCVDCVRKDNTVNTFGYILKQYKNGVLGNVHTAQKMDQFHRVNTQGRMQDFGEGRGGGGGGGGGGGVRHE